MKAVLANRTRVIIDGIRFGDVSGVMALNDPGSLYATDNATLEVLKVERLGPDALVEVQRYDAFDKVGERMSGGYASLLWRKLGGRWIIAADVSN